MIDQTEYAASRDKYQAAFSKLTEIVRINFREHISEQLGNSPEDVAYQIAWGIYHGLRPNGAFTDPLPNGRVRTDFSHRSLMEKLGLVTSNGDLTKEAIDLHDEFTWLYDHDDDVDD